MHRRDIHNRGWTLCGESARSAARDWTESDCDMCEAIQTVLEMRDYEDWSPAQAKAALIHAGWEISGLEARPWYAPR